MSAEQPPQPSQPRSSRREFLTWRIGEQRGSADGPAAGLVRPLAAGELGSLDRQSAFLETYSKPAMACQFEFLFNLHQYGQASTAAEDAFVLIDELESQMTIYRDDSEIIRLNRHAFLRPVEVEARLFQLLKRSEQIHRETGGAFDITAGQLSKLWGFEQRSGSIPTQSAINETLSRVGSQHVQLDDAKGSVKFGVDGLKINLGGIGKGYAIDRVESLFRMHGVHDFIIHGGQSSVKCGGNCFNEQQDQPDPGGGWPVGLSHPVLPGVRVAYFHLHDRALGTSGSGRQGFFHQGKRYGHIIDPRTGWPTDHFLSTTVLSPSAALSDALATAFFVMPLEAIEAYCDSHPEVSVVLIQGDPQAGKGEIELIWFNLDDDQWTRL